MSDQQVSGHLCTKLDFCVDIDPTPKKANTIVNQDASEPAEAFLLSFGKTPEFEE